jgi:predicted CopG family antitoxin
MESIIIKSKSLIKRKNTNFDFLKVIKSFDDPKDIRQLILKETNNYEVIDFTEKYFNLKEEETFIASTSTSFNIDKLNNNSVSGIVNLKKINDVRFINKFFESINHKLPNSGLFLGCVETYPNRRQALLEKYPPVINWFIYFFDTLFTRVFPKLKFTKKDLFLFDKRKRESALQSRNLWEVVFLWF